MSDKDGGQICSRCDECAVRKQGRDIVKILIAKILHGIAICVATICFFLAVSCDWLTSIALKLESSTRGGDQ